MRCAAVSLQAAQLPLSIFKLNSSGQQRERACLQWMMDLSIVALAAISLQPQLAQCEILHGHLQPLALRLR